MDVQNDYFSGNTLTRDLFNLFVGEQIGRGCGRTVFSLGLNPDFVAKIECEAGSFQNILEHQVWQAVEYTKFARWFAPIREISANGTILIQKRTEPIPRDRLPEKVPSFFTDLKPENWGLIDGKPVCHDYGFHLMLERGMTSRMKKADWLF